MAVSKRTVRGVEHETTSAYGTLERELITTAADGVRDAVENRKLGWWRLSAMRNRSRQLIGQLVNRARTAARTAISRAVAAGQQSAEHDLRQRGLPIVPAGTDQVVAKAAREIDATLTATIPHAIRSTDALYTQAVAAIHAQPATSQAARLRIAQRTLDDLTAGGVTGFIDRSGRNWNLVSYVEMATRTVALNAAVDAHTGTLAANGQDLVVVSSALACCPRCAVFDGHILSISGDGDHVALAEARADGLFHPNCRCVLHAWNTGDPLPTVVPPPSPEQYAATQHLRYLERQVRAAKRIHAAALTPDAQRAAGSRVRGYQAKIRAHIAATGTKRVRRREQIGRAL